MRLHWFSTSIQQSSAAGALGCSFCRCGSASETRRDSVLKSETKDFSPDVLHRRLDSTSPVGDQMSRTAANVGRVQEREKQKEILLQQRVRATDFTGVGSQAVANTTKQQKALGTARHLAKRHLHPCGRCRAPSTALHDTTGPHTRPCADNVAANAGVGSLGGLRSSQLVHYHLIVADSSS